MARQTYKIDATRTFGIEIEAYGAPMTTVCDVLNAAGLVCVMQGYNHTTCGSWKLVTDSSIVGENTFELVSPILAGPEGVAQIQTVCRVLTALDVKVNVSCGFHVHHGAWDLTLAHWKNLAKMYVKYETTLDSLMPVSRRANNSHWCRSLTSRWDSLSTAFGAINRATDLSSLADIFSGGDRYYKLNLTAFWRHGTVEVRHHSGTIDAEKICHWVSLTQCMVIRATRQNTVSTKGTDLAAVCLSGWSAKGDAASYKVSTATTNFYQTRQLAWAA